jgi:hypothetical protein
MLVRGDHCPVRLRPLNFAPRSNEASERRWEKLMNLYVWTCVCGKELREQADTKEIAQKEASRRGWRFTPLASCSTKCVAERLRRTVNSLGPKATIGDVVREADKVGLDLDVQLRPMKG